MLRGLDRAPGQLRAARYMEGADGLGVVASDGAMCMMFRFLSRLMRRLFSYVGDHFHRKFFFI